MLLSGGHTRLQKLQCKLGSNAGFDPSALYRGFYNKHKCRFSKFYKIRKWANLFLPNLQNLLPNLAKPDFEPFNVTDAKLSHELFKTAVVNYYMHDVISRHSVNMSNAIKEIVGEQ